MILHNIKVIIVSNSGDIQTSRAHYITLHVSVLRPIKAFIACLRYEACLPHYVCKKTHIQTVFELKASLKTLTKQMTILVEKKVFYVRNPITLLCVRSSHSHY